MDNFHRMVMGIIKLTIILGLVLVRHTEADGSLSATGVITSGSTSGLSYRVLFETPTTTPKPLDIKSSASQTALDRWIKFEADFGIEQRESSLVKGTLQTAKYQLDRSTFAIQEFVREIQKTLHFDYGLRDLGVLPSKLPSARSPSGNLLTEALNSARVKSEITLHGPSGGAFFGLKLVLTVGD